MSSFNRIVLSLKILRYKFNYLFLRVFHGMMIKGHLCVRNVRISDKGKNNRILAGKNVILENCKFFFQGDNHVVLLGDGIRICGVTFAFEKEGSCINLVGEFGLVLAAVCRQWLIQKYILVLVLCWREIVLLEPLILMLLWMRGEMSSILPKIS